MSIFTDRVDALQELKIVEQTDKFGFLQNIAGNWDNHRPILLLSLELTTGPVIEFGSGEGSTPFLRKYLTGHDRSFATYDSNRDWAHKTGSAYVESWNDPDLYRNCSVFFCDHAPGEHRKEAIKKMAGKADIIVIHDTEEGGAGNYGFESIWPLFKYRLNYNKNGGGAGASAVSNTIDLNRFRGLSLGKYKFDND